MDSYPNDREIFLIMKTQTLCRATLLVRVVIVLQTRSWALTWILMEINIVGITLQLMEEKRKEKIILFLVFQGLPAICLLTYLNVANKTLENIIRPELMVILLLSMVCKIGLFPIQNWIIKIRTSISWLNNYILITWQKIIPIALLIKIRWKVIMVNTITLSIIVITIYLMSITLIKPFIISSSLIHIRWVLISIAWASWVAVLYLILYSAILYNILTEIKKKSKKTIKRQIKRGVRIIKLSIFRAAGIPPTTGFIIKSRALIRIIIYQIRKIVVITMLMAATVSFYSYIQVVYKSLYIRKKTSIKNETEERGAKRRLTINTATPLALYII